MRRADVAFTSRGVTCRAWHYLPEAASEDSYSNPCVVMAHGFGATRDAALEPYAQRFVAAGLHVLLFDYRHFGASDGTPRQLVSVRRQLEDYEAAIAFARSLPGVDPCRIVAWGTSFSGGHALVTAARVQGIAAAVCQCPMMDGFAAVLAIVRYAGPLQLLRLTWHGLWDLVCAPLGRTHCVPTVAPPGRLGIMTSADAEPGYRALMPPGTPCEVAARIALQVATYRPVTSASRVVCPVLVQVCEFDSVAPPVAAERVVRALGAHAEVRRYSIGHFDPYRGAHFERSVGDQLDFLCRRLDFPAATAA